MDEDLIRSFLVGSSVEPARTDHQVARARRPRSAERGGDSSGGNWTAGSSLQIVLSFDALARATGLYAYTWKSHDGTTVVRNRRPLPGS